MISSTPTGAHSRSRVLHSQGDSTGAGILRALVAKAKKLRGIEIRPHSYAVDLLADSGRIAGVFYLDETTQSLKEIRAGSVLLATGGLGQVYKETTNPPVACGDGVAMAYRAGAYLSDMEFIQFHPTALYIQSAPRFLLSEALRGEGGLLRNIELERFMPRYHEAGELAPRDIVSRALVMEMLRCRSEFNYLDLTGLDAERVMKRFPKIYSTCLAFNIDITLDLIPVRPAARASTRRAKRRRRASTAPTAWPAIPFSKAWFTARARRGRWSRSTAFPTRSPDRLHSPLRNISPIMLPLLEP